VEEKDESMAGTRGNFTGLSNEVLHSVTDLKSAKRSQRCLDVRCVLPLLRLLLRLVFASRCVHRYFRNRVCAEYL
jgi:hypothetical protein